MHVLLTRPLEDSIDLIKRLQDKGFTVSHLPLIKINKIDYPKLDSSGYKVIVFTSSNAIRNLDTKDFDKKSLCFCVGDATEKTAKQKDFTNVSSNLLVVFLEIISNFFKISLLIRPLKIKNIKNIPKPIRI